MTPPSAPRRRRPPPRDLPAEIKVVMGFLVLYGLLSLLGLAMFLSVGSVPRRLIIPAALLALNVTLFVGLLLRTRWGWWGATITFALFAVYFAHHLLRGLIGHATDSPAEILSLGRLGLVGGIVFVGLYAVPFWILVSTRRRYWAARAARLRPGPESE